jgi:hypothetical protein
MDDFSQQQDAQLDSALNQLPIVPLPPDFTDQIMVNIRSATAHSVQRHVVQNISFPPVRYRLQFLDIALALFWSLTLIFTWMIILWWMGILRLEWWPQVQPSFYFIDQLSMANPAYLLAGIIFLLLEMSLLGLVGVSLWGERPS